MNNATLECSVLIRVESMMRQLAMHHPTDGMNEIPTVEIVEPVFIGIMDVRAAVEIMSRRVLHPILIVSILKDVKTREATMTRDLHSILLH